MNNFLKQVIEEKFASKAQQRFFYAKANEKGAKNKDKKKFKKWAKEFSDETDFDKIPEKVKKEEEKHIEAEVDEIVDEKGNISRSDIPRVIKKSTIGAKRRTDKVVKASAGAMGIHGVHGTHTSLRYWAESDMSGALGYDDTLGDDVSYDDAYTHFTKKLGLSDEEANERLKAMGYIPGENDMVRLVENPKKFMEDYIESVLVKKTQDSDIIANEEEVEQNINPLVLKQIESLKKSLQKNNISVDKIVNKLKGE